MYSSCAEPEARNSAVGWHWNTRIIFKQTWGKEPYLHVLGLQERSGLAWEGWGMESVEIH